MKNIKHSDYQNKQTRPKDWKISKKAFMDLNVTGQTKILDIGSGDGTKISYIVDEGQLVMTDLSAPSNSRITRADVHELQFKDNTFDIVTMFHVLEHLTDANKALAEIYRVMKKGGTMISVTPNEMRWSMLFSLLLKLGNKIGLISFPNKYPLNPDHVFEYSYSDLKSVFEESQFDEFTIQPIYMRISAILRLKHFCNQWIVIAQKD